MGSPTHVGLPLFKENMYDDWNEDEHYCDCPDCGHRHKLKTFLFSLELKIKQFGYAVRELVDPKFRKQREQERERLRILAQSMFTKEMVDLLKMQTPFQKLAEGRELPVREGKTIQLFQYEPFTK